MGAGWLSGPILHATVSAFNGGGRKVCVPAAAAIWTSPMDSRRSSEPIYRRMYNDLAAGIRAGR